jgi:hypothetical protein
MTDILLNLGQANPAANTLTTLYTVPAATSASVSSIVVCNLTSNTDSFRISIAVGGAADSLKQYIYYNLFMDANDTFIATVGLSMATTDVIRCYSTNGNLSFSAWGVEVQ